MERLGLWDLYNKAHTPLSWHKELFVYAKKLELQYLVLLR